MSTFRYYISVLLALVLVSSCSSSRKAVQSYVAKTENQSTSQWNAGDCVTARSNVNLQSGKTDVTLGGTLRMKRDDVIQLNLTYNMLITIQVGTLELRNDSALLVSRYTRQYAVCSYDEFSRLIGRQVTFQEVQKFFWGEAESVTSGPIVLTFGNMQNIDENHKLPGHVTMQLNGTKNRISLDLELSNFNRNTDWQTRTEFSRERYSRVTLDQIVRMLTSVAQ